MKKIFALTIIATFPDRLQHHRRHRQGHAKAGQAVQGASGH
jgi:hypothetical protein